MKAMRWVVPMLAVLLAASPCPALEIGGAGLPDTLSVDGKDLVLNGAGLRKKLFIKVYAMGLYLPEKTGDARRIIEADEPMAARMHFIYNGVSAKDIVDAWNEGFVKSTGGNLGPIQDRIQTFNGYFSGEAKTDEVYDFVYIPGKGVQTILGGKDMGTIPGLDFKQALFGIWLGDEPPDSGLKKGMLGE